MPRETFTIEEYEKKESRGGKTYGRLRAKGVGWASVWHDGDRKFAYENVGNTVEGLVEEKDGYKNVSELKLVGAAGTAPAGTMAETKRDVSIVRQVSYKVAASVFPELVKTLREDQQGYGDYLALLQNAAHAIEEDILAEDPPEPVDMRVPEDAGPPPDDDIPF